MYGGSLAGIGIDYIAGKTPSIHAGFRITNTAILMVFFREELAFFSKTVLNLYSHDLSPTENIR